MLDLFKILIFILQLSMGITLFVGLPLLLVVRILTVIYKKRTIKESLLIILVPFSIGYFMYVDEEDKFYRLYKLLLVIFLVTAILGILFTLYLKLF